MERFMGNRNFARSILKSETPLTKYLIRGIKLWKHRFNLIVPNEFN